MLYTKGTLVFYVRPALTLVFCTRPASSSSIDAIPTSKSRHRPHRFDLSFFFLSLSFFSSSFLFISLFQDLDSLLRRSLKGASHVCPKLVRTMLPPQIVEIAYELIKLYVIHFSINDRKYLQTFEHSHLLHINYFNV